jgi:hypothetical protein
MKIQNLYLTLVAGLSLIAPIRAAEKIPTNEAVMLQVGEKSVGLKDLLADFKETKIKVIEPEAKKEVEFVGFPIIELLDKYAGKTWRKADGVLFTALDGYKSDVLVKKILKYNPVLAYRYANNAEFKINNPGQNEKNVSLAPYYLVWDNIKNPELKRAGGYNWPYQVAALSSIEYSKHYAKAFPLLKASADEKAGFDYFKNYCMTCHAVGGEGGTKGPTLWPYPALFAGGLQRFTAWTIEPSKIKAGTTMPPLNPELTVPERKEISKKIYAYLSALHKLKSTPKK